MNWDEAVRTARSERKQWDRAANVYLGGARRDIILAIVEELKKCDIPMLQKWLSVGWEHQQDLNSFVQRLADETISMTQLPHRDD